MIILDSQFGNTKRVAEAMRDSLVESGNEVELAQAKEFPAVPRDKIDFLMIGSPTQGGRATAAIHEMLKDADWLKGIRAAAFDTRIQEAGQKWGLRMLMKVIGYAAPKIEADLRRAGAVIAAPSEGFIVEDKEGPLREGELERAAVWAKRLAE